MRSDFESIRPYIARLYDLGRTTHDDRALLYADFFIGQSQLLSRGIDSTRHYLTRALERAQRIDDSVALARICNALGIYTVGVGMDYRGGIAYFLRAMDYACGESGMRENLAAQCNLANVYCMRNDPAGLKYAEEVYRRSCERGFDYLAFGGAVICAYMHYQLGQQDRALEYLKVTLHETDKYGYHTEIYSLYANILHAQGHDARAEKYYRMALGHVDDGVVTAGIFAYLSCGTYLNDRKQHAEAIPSLRRGLALSVRNSNTVHRYRIYRELSEAEAALGDYRRALQYYRIFHAEADSIFNVERERSINELRIRYEAEQQLMARGIYRQNDLTIERLAELLGTNRTYLSQAINRGAGKTFSGYLNGYRIDEAMRRLSDVDDDTRVQVTDDGNAATVLYDASGGAVRLTVATTLDWSFETDASLDAWCEVLPAGAGLQIDADRFARDERREGTVRITAGGKTCAAISVVQQGMGADPALFVERDEMTFYDNGGDCTLAAMPNQTVWRVGEIRSAAGEWLKAEPSGDGRSLQLMAPANDTKGERSATVVLEACDGDKVTTTAQLVVTQWQPAMVFEIETTKPNTLVALPFKGSVKLRVVWDDRLEQVDTYERPVETHSDYVSYTYPEAGSYRVRVLGEAETLL